MLLDYFVHIEHNCLALMEYADAMRQAVAGNLLMLYFCHSLPGLETGEVAARSLTNRVWEDNRENLAWRNWVSLPFDTHLRVADTLGDKLRIEDFFRIGKPTNSFPHRLPVSTATPGSQAE